MRFDDDKVERIEYLERDNNKDMQVELDLDTVAPEGYQLNREEDEEMHESTTNVHFTKPSQDDLDLDDPDFSISYMKNIFLIYPKRPKSYHG